MLPVQQPHNHLHLHPQQQQLTAALPITNTTKLRLATDALTTANAMVREHAQHQVGAKELLDLLLQLLLLQPLQVKSQLPVRLLKCQYQLTQRQSGTLQLKVLSNTP